MMVTVNVGISLLLFSILKFSHLVTHKSPIIGKFLEFDQNGSSEESIDFNKSKLAFTVRDFKTKEIKADPQYVEWLVGIYEGDGVNDSMVQEIGVHKCNKLDWE
jgi:hypothetical protein